MTKAAIRLERLFTEATVKLPWAAGFINWLRNPKNAIIRVPVALLLIVGGIFSFLPLLGLWMLPLGLIFLAIDFIWLQEPVTKAIVIGKRKAGQLWNNMRRLWKKNI